MKSLYAWLRKSRCTEFPGPLPMIPDEAIAILAWPTCALLNISKLSGDISAIDFSCVCFTRRSRHTGTREPPGTWSRM